MANNSYTVRLIDCAGSSGGVDSNTTAVGASLTAWYRSVCQQATSGDTTWTADVQWQTQPGGNSSGQDAGNPITINLIIFFVPSPRESVIKLHPQFRTITLPAESDPGIWGTTVSRFTPPGAGVGHRTPTLGISEVYVSRCRDTASATTQLNLARIGFHESMHNQLIRVGDELHRGNGGFAADTPTGTAPSAPNLQMMAAAIGILVPQWPDGFQAWRNKANDPLGGF
jgi:hypothetical protein